MGGPYREEPILADRPSQSVSLEVSYFTVPPRAHPSLSLSPLNTPLSSLSLSLSLLPSDSDSAQDRAHTTRNWAAPLPVISRCSRFEIRRCRLVEHARPKHARPAPGLTAIPSLETHTEAAEAICTPSLCAHRTETLAKVACGTSQPAESLLHDRIAAQNAREDRLALRWSLY